MAGTEDEDVEYVPEALEVPDDALQQFGSVFARFQATSEEPQDVEMVRATFCLLVTFLIVICVTQDIDGKPTKGEVYYSDDDMASDAGSDAGPTALSKRKQRKLARLSVAELKQLVKKPEVVDWVDVTATDPRLLIHLKSVRNTVPVPPHWSAKRDYLQGKRGIEKPPYQLPSYIADTGIGTMRDALKEKEATMSLKQKTRERVQPKMGKIDIDYQKLHDAFFKFATKPVVSAYGEMCVSHFSMTSLLVC